MGQRLDVYGPQRLVGSYKYAVLFVNDRYAHLLHLGYNRSEMV